MSREGSELSESVYCDVEITFLGFILKRIQTCPFGENLSRSLLLPVRDMWGSPPFTCKAETGGAGDVSPFPRLLPPPAP